MSEKLKQLIIKHFPFESFNDGQYEAIEKTIKAFLLKKKHVILEAPTGVGKSAIATTVHRVLRDINRSFRTTIVTATKGLQDQYISDDPEIYDLKGRGNYSCPHGVGPYNSAKCRIKVAMTGCDKAVSCEYFKRRTEWCLRAPLRLTNTSFQIVAPPLLTEDPESRANLIILDECHELAKELISQSIVEFDSAQFAFSKNLLDENFFFKLASAKESFNDIKVGEAFRPHPIHLEEVNALSKTCKFWIKQFENSKITHEQNSVDELMEIDNKLCLFIDNEHGEWILKERTPEKVVLLPVYAHQVAEHALFKKSDRFLHMSATICGFDVYMRELGLTEKETTIIRIDNPIPIKNRKVIPVCNVKVNANVNKQILVQEIDKIIDKHGNENGIIHTVSFSLAQDIINRSKHAGRMLVSNKREEIEYTLNKFNQGNIILSPSIEKGYDFKGDMARFNIISKVPYGFLGDPYIKLNLDRDQKWYAREAIGRLVQASGRTTRGVNDFSITYIIDSNFNRLFLDNSEIFPEWYIDSIEI